MERLTTNDPLGNVETAHNLFYVKNAEVWVCGGGAAPDYADITLYDFIRQIVQSLGPMSIDTSVPDEELGEELCELLFDGTGTIEGLVATLYTAAWAFADLRNRLASYEDTGLEPDEITDFLPTLKEWRQNMGALRHVHELVTAEAENRLLVLPCKPMTTVYVIEHVDCYMDTEACPMLDESGRCNGEGEMPCPLHIVEEVADIDSLAKWIVLNAFGKTAFLSREAAEAALEAREGA